jgi:hypothetical protein
MRRNDVVWLARTIYVSGEWNQRADSKANVNAITLKREKIFAAARDLQYDECTLRRGYENAKTPKRSACSGKNGIQ